MGRLDKPPFQSVTADADNPQMTGLVCPQGLKQVRGMPRTLGPVALKRGDEVLVKGGRFQDVEGFDVTAHYSEDLPDEGENAIRQPIAGVSMAVSTVQQDLV
ncbi:hypothetical protein ABBQ38_004286 [Trebouxia sp. C0009 RCD-2024]